jgi:GTP-binding protein
VFIDQAKIYVRGGKGGNGCQSLYRDKYTRRGIPDGGDGGKGSDILIRADRNLYTLMDFKYNQHFYGQNGGNGSGKQKKGKDSPPVIIRVPIGTVVRDLKNDCILRDLKEDGEGFIVAEGGKGGLGNRHHRETTPGEIRTEKEILLDLKLIAEAGLVGFPNAGKSTLISNISNAHPKVAAYPFTTLAPVLGVVKTEKRNFIIADIPGLIAGSSAGRGLGDKFLRHIERTNVLIHLIDISGFEGRDPLEDYRVINKELEEYSKEVYKKKQILVANKMDIEGAKANLKRFKAKVKKKIYPISALKKEGLEELVEAIVERL